MKPGDIVSFDICKKNRSLIGARGELVTLHSTATTSVVKTKHRLFYDEPEDKEEYLYDVSTRDLKLITSKEKRSSNRIEAVQQSKDYLIPGRVVVFRDRTYGIVSFFDGQPFIMTKDHFEYLQCFDDNSLRHHHYYSNDIIKIGEMKRAYSLDKLKEIESNNDLKILWRASDYEDTKIVSFYAARESKDNGTEFIKLNGKIASIDYDSGIALMKSRERAFHEDVLQEDGYFYYAVPLEYIEE